MSILPEQNRGGRLKKTDYDKRIIELMLPPYAYGGDRVYNRLINEGASIARSTVQARMREFRKMDEAGQLERYFQSLS